MKIANGIGKERYKQGKEKKEERRKEEEGKKTGHDEVCEMCSKIERDF